MMSENAETESPEEVMDDIQNEMALQMELLAAQEGDADAFERVSKPRTLEKVFPGHNKDAALGYADYYVGLFEKAGVDARAEYKSLETPAAESHTGSEFHRIDIVVEGPAGE